MKAKPVNLIPALILIVVLVAIYSLTMSVAVPTNRSLKTELPPGCAWVIYPSDGGPTVFIRNAGMVDSLNQAFQLSITDIMQPRPFNLFLTKEDGPQLLWNTEFTVGHGKVWVSEMSGMQKHGHMSCP